MLLLVLGMASQGMKVTVLGGTGFTGSRVCKSLVESGCDVTSVSKSGTVPAWAASEPWAASVSWKAAGDFTRGSREALATAIGSPDAVVSTVGVVGFDVQGLLLGNGKANVEAAAISKEAGVAKYVLVSVASEVSRCYPGWLPDFFRGYFEGKAQAEAAVINAVGEDNACIVKPTFIYGGDEFGLFPPRVNSAYGSAVEELLSTPLFKAAADALPGLIKVALRPPVSVDAVAAACAASVLGKTDAKVLDGTEEINAAADQDAATGLTDFLSTVKEKVSSLAADK